MSPSSKGPAPALSVQAAIRSRTDSQTSHVPASHVPAGSPSPGRLYGIGFTVIAAAGLVYLLHRVGWDTIGGSLVRVGWMGAVAIVLLGVVEAAFDALAFKAAIPEPISTLPVLGCNQAGGLLNRFVPWEAGEVLKTALLRRRISGLGAVTGTLLWNYLFKLSKPIVTLMAALVGLLWGEPKLRPIGGWMLLGAALAFLPYGGLYLLFRVGVAHHLFRGLARVRLLGNRSEALLAKALSVDSALRGFFHDRPRAYLETLTYQLLARVAAWTTFHATLILLGQPFSVGTTAALWAALSMMGYLIGILPTRLGTTEAGAFLVFGLVGLDPAVGLATQLILTIKATLVAGGCMVFAFI